MLLYEYDNVAGTRLFFPVSWAIGVVLGFVAFFLFLHATLKFSARYKKSERAKK
jgi:hypothetical protein